MTRGILKSNRHKKLKAVDPFYTGDRKLLLDKGLVNANQAPSSKTDNETKLPMKIREYMELNAKINEKTNAAKKLGKAKRSNDKALLNEALYRGPDERGAEIPVRPTAKFVKSKHETERQFLTRIDKHSQAVIHRSQYEHQFDVKLETNDKTVVIKKEKKMSEKKRNRLNNLKEKLKMKKMEKSGSNNKANVKDKVKFGDIVHAPPVITARPRLPKVKESTAPRVIQPPTIPSNKPSKTGITENDRNVVIQRYRLMKSAGKFK